MKSHSFTQLKESSILCQVWYKILDECCRKPREEDPDLHIETYIRFSENNLIFYLYGIIKTFPYHWITTPNATANAFKNQFWNYHQQKCPRSFLVLRCYMWYHKSILENILLFCLLGELCQIFSCRSVYLISHNHPSVFTLCADIPAVLHSSLYFINPFVIHPLLSLIITSDKRGHNCSINYSLFGVHIVILSAIILCTLS